VTRSGSPRQVGSPQNNSSQAACSELGISAFVGIKLFQEGKPGPAHGENIRSEFVDPAHFYVFKGDGLVFAFSPVRSRYQAAELGCVGKILITINLPSPDECER